MKKLALLLPFLLSGCFDDTTEIKTHINNVKVNTTSRIAPMPEVAVFNHVNYDAQNMRSPFKLPQPEAIQEKMQQMSGCLSPDPRRRKQPLEKFAISDLTMRGTMGELGITWGLVEASDLTLHRVSTDSYIGLFNGKITSVNQKSIAVVELIPDGAGCWAERETVIKMSESDSKGQRK